MTTGILSPFWERIVHPRSNAQPANVIAAMVGNGVYAAGIWIQLLIVARFCSVEATGDFSLAQAIVIPSFLFAGLNLRAALATDARCQYALHDYFLLRGVTSAVALVIIVTIGIALLPAKFWLLVTLSLAKASESFAELLWGHWQRHGRMYAVARSQVWRSVVGTALFFVVISLTHDSTCATVALAAAWWWLLFSVDSRGMIRRRPSSSSQCYAALLRLVRNSLPLGAALFFISLSMNIPRYFVKSILGSRELAFLSAIFSITTIGAVFINAIGQTATPRLSLSFASRNRRQFHRLLRNLVAVGLLAGIVGAIVAFICGDKLLLILYGSAYGGKRSALVGLMLAAALLYAGSLLGYGVTATRQFDRLVAPYFVEVLLTAVASAILIPRYGLAGAVASFAFTGLAACAVPLYLLVTIEVSDEQLT